MVIAAVARASHAIGLVYGIAGLGNAVGPLIGGLLTETVGWRWIFWLNVPLTLVVLAIGARSITETFDETVPRRIDVAGLALITVGIGLFTLTFDRAPSWGWLSAPTVIAFAGSLAALAVFVVAVVEKRVRWPFVELLLVQNPRFTVLVIAGTIAKHRLRRDDLPVDDVPAGGTRPRPVDGGLVFLGPSGAGEAAGVTLTALVTLVGVGVAVSGTELEMLQRAGMSPAGAVDAIVVVLAALLLAAGVVVLSIARASNSGTGT